MRRSLLFVSLFLSLGFGWEGRVVRLERELDTGDPQRRAEVVHQLAAYGDRAGPGVLRALDDVDVGVRVEAAAVAGSLHLRDAEPRLTGYLDEPETPLREAAVAALGALGDVRAAPAIVRALGDADARVRRAGVTALGALGSLPAEPGTTAVDCVVPVLGRLDDDDPSVRAEAADVLAQLHDGRAVVPLVGKARDTAPEVRTAVYAALGSLGDRRALLPLLSALEDDDPDARLGAVAALGRLGDADATDALTQQLSKPDPRLIRAATAALAALPGDRALAAVASELSQPVASSLAADALVARLRAQRDEPARATIVAAVVQRLDAGDPVRAPCALLVRFADTTSIASAEPTLSRLFAGPAGRDPGLAIALARAAPQPDEPSSAPTHARPPDEGNSAPTRAPQPDEGHSAPTRAPQPDEPSSAPTHAPPPDEGAPSPGLIALLESLAGGDPQREDAALAGLTAYFASHAADGRAADPLVAALARVRRDHRARVVTLLGAVRASRALVVLRPLLAASDDAELRRAAVDALGRIGDPAAAPLLLPLLDDPAPETRMLAARALGQSASADTVRALVARLVAPAPTDRHAVLVALGPALDTTRARLPTPDLHRAEAALLAAARSSDATLAARACDAIALSGDAALAPGLASLVRDAGPTTRIAALRALGALLSRTRAGDGGRRDAAGDPPATGVSASDAARASAGDAALTAATTDHDPDVRTAALGVAGERARPDAPALSRLLDAADGAQGPASSAAAFALARLARRGALSDANVAPRLCALLHQREPYVRANAMVALAALHAVCADGPAPTSYLGSAHAEPVREAAARWAFAATPTSAETLDALARCASGDPSERVAAACTEPALPPLDDVADVTAWSADGRRPLARTLVALRLADGSALVARTDANAHLLLVAAPHGPLAVDDPLDLPLDPP